ncbi:type II toxin-antitoxin system RelE/ParE family toxin [Hyphobacterium sp. CCMP332]|nr:type II toxin-antitoxin system RelE/ParE family toxin [Hyphobacterium sp. CCMP332]
MKDVRWTRTAKKSLQETSEFILELWNLKIKEEFIEQVDYRIKQIQRNPKIAPKFKDNQIRRLVIHNTVSLFYIDKPKYIKLLLIWDNRQDPDSLLDKLTDANNV